MNFPFFIARRYFFSRIKIRPRRFFRSALQLLTGKTSVRTLFKNTRLNFTSLITLISVIGLCVGSAALVVVLSVFNGMEDLIRSLNNTFSAEMQVRPAQGKTFLMTPALNQQISHTPGVAFLTEVLEDDVLLMFREARTVVKMRGTDEKMLLANGLNDKITEGKLVLTRDSLRYALLGAGVQYALSVAVDEKNVFPLEVIYPKNRKRLNFNSQDAFTRKYIRPAGVFAIEQRYDASYIFVPLAFAQEMFEAGNQRSFLEIKTLPGSDLGKVQNQLKAVLGNAFVVQNRDEQNAQVYKAIRIEKLFVYLTLTFIIAISAFNIFFSLTMLAIEKQRDLAVLQAMGADSRTIYRIFLSEGGLVAVSGVASGMVLGLGLCVLQLQTGIFKMGIETAVVNAYPVKIQITDLFFTAITVTTITLLAAWLPASRAARLQDLARVMKK